MRSCYRARWCRRILGLVHESVERLSEPEVVGAVFGAGAVAVDQLAAGRPDAALPAAPEPAAEPLVRAHRGAAPLYSRRALQSTACSLRSCEPRSSLDPTSRRLARDQPIVECRSATATQARRKIPQIA
jgi:hypothetical protein